MPELPYSPWVINIPCLQNGFQKKIELNKLAFQEYFVENR
jgi:hypothetical protein